jgi:hypothetical protein
MSIILSVFSAYEEYLAKLQQSCSRLVSAHLAKWFQRGRFKCEKLTDDGRQVMAKARPGELKRYNHGRTK